MEVIFLIVVVFGIALVFVGLSSRKKDNSLPKGQTPNQLDPLADAPGGGGPFWELKTGDLVKQFAGSDFIVRRTINLTEGGYRWNEHLLDDAQGRRQWLSVEDDDGLDLGLWEPVAIGAVGGMAGDKTVTVDDKEFRLQEDGSARYNSIDGSGQPTYGEVEYFQYEADDKTMLAFQRYDGSKWEASLGQTVAAGDLEIFPVTEPVAEQGDK